MDTDTVNIDEPDPELTAWEEFCLDWDEYEWAA